MRRLALAALVLLAGLVPAFAYDTPKALLEAIYAPYLVASSDWQERDETLLRSAGLNALFAKDSEEAGGEVGRIDFDPYINGQDWQIADLSIGEPMITGDTATAEVTFSNFDDPQDMTFSLVKEADGWKVDNVVSRAGEYPYDLKQTLSAPLAQ